MTDSILNSFYLYISNLFKSTKQCKIVMLGEYGGGKTTLLYRIKNGPNNEKFIPTIGFNYEDVQYKDLNLRIIDVGGGGGKLHPLWPSYFEKDLNVLIYVIDCSERCSFDESVNHLINSVNHPNFPQQALVQVLANKQDLPNFITIEEIEIRLKQEQHQLLPQQSLFNNRKYIIQSISAINGTGIEESLSWIYENVKSQ